MESLYRINQYIASAEKRGFYEIETIKSNWSVRELRKQVIGLLYERLAKNKNSGDVIKLRQKP